MFSCRDPEDVLKITREKGVASIQFWFTDVLGQLKSFSVTPQELRVAFAEGMGFDGSSIEGFARIEESDMVAFPDPMTFQLLPWRANDRPTGRMFCDIFTPEGTPYEGDPRHALKRMLARAAERGYTFFVGPELEYFYFKSDAYPEILDRGGYFDVTPLDRGGDLRRETIFALQKMGIDVEYSHHEVSPSQHEIDLRYDEALRMGDTTQTYRIAVRETARQHGVYASFMPKPLFGQNGSGMHVHQSLFSGDSNAFFDAGDPFHLSTVARRYIAGILRHASEIIAITNQWVNSYKRLVPGYEAPVYISWARRNRSTMVRVPMYKPGKEKATRIEFRAPDPACNPYLAFAVMLAAGLAGIENGYALPEPVEEDIYSMSSEERSSRGIDSLPGSLYEAIVECEKSQLVQDAVGGHIFRKFIENKKIEWEMYRIQVTSYEIDRYLPMF